MRRTVLVAFFGAPWFDGQLAFSRKKMIEESGTVVEVRGTTALVRLQRSGACTGCASAGSCRAGRGADDQFLEARNDPGAMVGDRVRVAVSVGSAIAVSAKRYLLPLASLLLGAAVAQFLANVFIPGPAVARAAGFGGIAGAILGVLLMRRFGGLPAGGSTPLPFITRVTQIRAYARTQQQRRHSGDKPDSSDPRVTRGFGRHRPR